MNLREANARHLACGAKIGKRNCSDEYVLTVQSAEVVLDATAAHCDARYTSHGCSSNTRLVTISC